MCRMIFLAITTGALLTSCQGMVSAGYHLDAAWSNPQSPQEKPSEE